jgi:hypothetical protein
MPRFMVNIGIEVEAKDFDEAGDLVWEMMQCHPSVTYTENTIYHLSGEED